MYSVELIIFQNLPKMSVNLTLILYLYLIKILVRLLESIQKINNGLPNILLEDECITNKEILFVSNLL